MLIQIKMPVGSSGAEGKSIGVGLAGAAGARLC